MTNDLIIFGEDWGRHPSSTQHLAKRLVNDRNVLWVNSLGLRRPRFTSNDFVRLCIKGRDLLTKNNTPKSDVNPHPFSGLIQPKALPFPGSRLASAVNRQLLSRQIGEIAKIAGLDRPVLWTSLPTALPVLGTLGERAIVYYAGDDFGALSGVDHEPVLRMEHELAKRADLILAASPMIAERFDPNKTTILAHGVDFELFSNPVETPKSFKSLRKIAGFYGSLNDWIDVNALADAAMKLPDWTFVFIGRVETDIRMLTRFANVRFECPKPHCDLPAYSQNWTVSLLPFLENRQIDASNPLKLREYLAAGTPIAASYAFPALTPYRPAVSVVRPGKTLADAIIRAEADGYGRLKRRALVAAESWESRASHVANLIDAM